MKKKIIVVAAVLMLSSIVCCQCIVETLCCGVFSDTASCLAEEVTEKETEATVTPAATSTVKPAATSTAEYDTSASATIDEGKDVATVTSLDGENTVATPKPAATAEPTAIPAPSFIEITTQFMKENMKLVLICVAAAISVIVIAAVIIHQVRKPSFGSIILKCVTFRGKNVEVTELMEKARTLDLSSFGKKPASLAEIMLMAAEPPVIYEKAGVPANIMVYPGKKGTISVKAKGEAKGHCKNTKNESKFEITIGSMNIVLHASSR